MYQNNWVREQVHWEAI